MNNYIPSYYDELSAYREDDTIGIREKVSSLDRMRNILADLRFEIVDMTNGIEMPEEIENVIIIILAKINRRISRITITINKLLESENNE